ncbi:MAG: replication endonuclease [Janthinobacterium lividum]
MNDASGSLVARKASPADVFSDIFPTGPQDGFYFETVSDYGCFNGWDEDIFFTILPNPESALDQIAQYDEDELTQLARVIALSHRQYLAMSTDAERALHVEMPHAFGIKVPISKKSTMAGLAGRLSDARWWRRQINRLADNRREHLAQINRKLGRREAEQCCSEATLSIMRARKLKTDKFLGNTYRVVSGTVGLETPRVFSLLEVAQAQQANRIHELYVDIKAMEKIATDRGWAWVFITLTASSEYHSNPALGRNVYNADLRPSDANKAIGRDWVAIGNALKERGFKPSETYFGFRVTEVHEDGCPHWHILVFHAQGVMEVIEMTIKRLYQNRPSSYFEKNKGKILRVGLSKGTQSAASAASYIYGYLAFALSGGEKPAESSGAAYKYQCAIRAMSARQYQLFGVKGARGKLRALAKVKRMRACPENIVQLASRLHVDNGVDGRNEMQLNARVDFLLGAADKIQLVKETVFNSFGEPVKKTVAIRHLDDEDSVIISGLSDEIDAEVARRILGQ